MRQRQVISLIFLFKIFAMTLKSKVKFVKSLQLKKYRVQAQSFVVEGWKGVEALINSDFQVSLLAVTDSYYQQAWELVKRNKKEISDGLHVVSSGELERMGGVEANDSALAVARMKPEEKPIIGRERILVLDDIRDPGNMGTMIRTADWFGIRQVIASKNSVDFYNPKVIRSTMGSYCDVQVSYVDLPEFLKHSKVPVYGAFLEGDHIQNIHFENNALIVIGNESNGISPDILPFIHRRVSIQGFGKAESLNASVAAGVILYAATLKR